ncbi:patatin-like phospholipase, putative [Plasmodium yoelii]|nr:patatin-like phospholipase, putative [Plasmodium yoelii]CDU19045.1 patatin-like phospholipase, putative [Plasmodium yoelii]VTZ79630.1 patatin-like phospholipase, putative [Plasmodium yoelii]|eukprot:XP_022812461.1 patatin-like phospholipase, putative [Plasmodium yoelii]
MTKNVYILFVYIVYVFLHMFSSSLRMQKNLFKYITPISKKINLTRIKKIKIFRKERKQKNIHVFNDAVNKYIGFDAFFKKLNNVSTSQDKLNYINMLQKIIEDKKCEYFLFSNNYMRIIIYILNERFLMIKKNEYKNDATEYQIIYKLLLIFNNLTKYRNFYHVILNDYTHKNVKISLIYIIMNILNEKRNKETHKEANSVFDYFTSFFKNPDETTKKYIDQDNNITDEQIKRENDIKKKNGIDDIKNKIFHLGKNILLKVKEEKLKIENKLNEQYNNNNDNILKDQQYTKRQLEYYQLGQNDISLSKENKNENPDDNKMIRDDHTNNSYYFNNNIDNYHDKNIYKGYTNSTSQLNYFNEDLKNIDNIIYDNKKDKQNNNENYMKNLLKYYNNDDNEQMKSDQTNESTYEIKKGNEQTEDSIGNYTKQNDISFQNKKDEEMKYKNMNKRIHETIKTPNDHITFVPFYFNKNSKDNILTSIIVNFQKNQNGIVVYKRKNEETSNEKISDKLEENKSEYLIDKTITKLKKKGIPIENIGDDYNCNNYYEVYDNYAEDDTDILNYERNMNDTNFNIKENDEKVTSNGYYKTGSEINQKNEGQNEKNHLRTRNEHEDVDEKNVEENFQKENKKTNKNNDINESDEILEEDELENNSKNQTNSGNEYDENNVNVVYEDHNINIKDINNKTDVKMEENGNFLNMGLLILVKKNPLLKDVILPIENENNKMEINKKDTIESFDSNDINNIINNPLFSNSTKGITDNPYNYLKVDKFVKNIEKNLHIYKKREHIASNVEGYDKIYLKFDERQNESEEMDKYVLMGYLNFNLDMLKNFKMNNEENNLVMSNNPINNNNNPYLHLELIKNYIESLFSYLDINSYFTNKLLKLLYEILIENRNSIIYNMFYYTILNDENMNKIIDILSKSVSNNLNKSNITFMLRILYILSFQQHLYINNIKEKNKINEKFMILYKNIAKYLEDIKGEDFIKNLQKNEKLITSLKNVSLFFENKYKNQNSLYIRDEKKEQFLVDNKIVKKKLNNIYNRHFICEHKDLIIIRKTNIILKALGANMFDLYNDIVFTDREKKSHEYLMKENSIQKNIMYYYNDTITNFVSKIKKFFTFSNNENVPNSKDNIEYDTHTLNNKDNEKLKTDNNKTWNNSQVKNNYNNSYYSSDINEYTDKVKNKILNNMTDKINDTNIFTKMEEENKKKNSEKEKKIYIYNFNNKEYITFDKFKESLIKMKHQRKRKLRILCLDGGGIRGLLSIEILKCINSHLKKNLFEYFDIICGTSTGAIISILIGLEKAHLNEIEFLYNLLINKIFQKDTYAVRNTRYLLKHSYYDSNVLNNILNTFFKNTKMFHYNSDLFTPYVFTVSTQMNITPVQPVILKNYHVNLNRITELNKSNEQMVNAAKRETNDILNSGSVSHKYDISEYIRDNSKVVDVSNNNNNINQEEIQSHGNLEDNKNLHEYYNSRENLNDNSKIKNSKIHINQNVHDVSIYKSFYNIFVKYVLRCTTAAPGFFNFFTFDDNIYADGAICFNNPTLISLNEMKLIFYNYLNKKKNNIFNKIKYYYVKKDNISETEQNDTINLNDYIDCIVSIGTGKFQPKIIHEYNENKEQDTFLRWDVLLKQIVFSITNTELTHDICNNLLDKNKYFRFNCFINNIKLDETSSEIITKLKQIGKRYFEDDKYNQQKLIQLINILEDKKDVKEYIQNQKKIWNPSYIDHIKSKIYDYFFPKNKKSMNEEDSPITDSSQNSNIGKNENLDKSENIKNENKKNNNINSTKNNNADSKDNKENQKNTGGNLYSDFNFNFLNDDNKIDITNIDEILDIINRNSNNFPQSKNTSNGFFQYFTNLFYNNSNNKFIKKLENMNKNNLFIKKKKETSNYVNVTPNTGIRVLLNEIYFILLKKNLYFYTDQISPINENPTNYYDINIQKYIPYPPDQNNQVSHTNEDNHQKQEIENTCKKNEDNEQSSMENNSKNENIKKSDYFNKTDSNNTNDIKNNYNKNNNNDPYLYNDEQNLLNIVENSDLIKKKNIKNIMSSYNINYKFFKSINPDSLEIKKNMIFNVLRNIFFKNDT